MPQPRQIILPHSDKALKGYHQKLSWKISKDDWGSENFLFLQLQTKIPGTSPYPNQPGGCVALNRERKSIGFLTQWSKAVDLDQISQGAICSIKLDDRSSVRIMCDKIAINEYNDWNMVFATNDVKLEYDLLYDADGFFTIEAELKVDLEEATSKKSEFVKDMEGIFSDSKTSDVVVIAGSKRFHCHKNILSARCVVFKNMLAPNTLESELNTIEVKEAPAEAVASMLKYIYHEKVPDNPKKLTLDLLNLAAMYLLDPLTEACLKSLIERLDVVSCISTFIMADRYMPIGGPLKEMVIKFMKCKVEEVVTLEDWEKLVTNHPALATELTRAIVKGSKEKHLCQFCVISY